MSIKINGTNFVIPSQDEIKQLVAEAYEQSGLPVQPKMVQHQQERAVKKLDGLMEFLEPIVKNRSEHAADHEEQPAPAAKRRRKATPAS